MRSFDEYNPFVTAFCILCITGAAMFTSHPLVNAACFVGGMTFCIMKSGRRGLSSHVFLLLIFAVTALANPLVSHGGKTVLLVVNDSPITLESLLYGVNSALMAVGVIYWFRVFTIIMTSDRLQYLTGRLSPKLALVLSMSLRFIPLFVRQYRVTADAQKAMGLFKEDNIIDSIRGRLRIFSIVTTWALENSITVSASMEARGCGTGRRTSCIRYGFTSGDALVLSACAVPAALCAAAAARGSLRTEFNPEITGVFPDKLGTAAVAAYCALVLLPIIIETRAEIKWRYLRSRI